MGVWLAVLEGYRFSWLSTRMLATLALSSPLKQFDLSFANQCVAP